MKTRLIISCLIIYSFHHSIEAQSPLPLSRKPTKSEITLSGGQDKMTGALTGVIVGSIKIKIPINGSIDNYNRKKKKLGRYTVKYDGSPTY